MSILSTKVSWFKSTINTEVQKSFPISVFLNFIKGGKWKDKIDRLRSEENPTVKKDIKRILPTVAFHGTFEYSRKATNFTEASGIIILDIDDIPIDAESDLTILENVQLVKQEIMDSFDSVLACLTSPSGNGIKVLYYVEPSTITKDNYRAIGKEIISRFSDYGDVDFLSITDTMIVSYDSDILINEEAEPDYVYVKDPVRLKGELEERDDSIPLWEDAEDFFETVLDQEIAEKTNSNFHFIQVSLLDLAKFGFYHPEQDLSFIVNYSENHFKSSKDNQTRFKEAAELARDYPQLKWAYNTTSGGEQSEMVDYSDYIDYGDDYDEDDKYDDEPDTGVVDYSTLYSKVVETILEGDRVGREVSLSNFADVFRFKGTGILTITGIPGHGKTEFTDQLTIDLARLYGETSLVIGFEKSPEEHIIKLCRKMIGTNVTYDNWWTPSNEEVFKKNYDFVINHVQHINTTKTGGNINELLIKCAEWVQQQKRDGKNPRYLVLDPFNMLSIKGRYSGHEKVEEILRQLTHFSHQMGILVILIAHPFKMQKDEKTGEYNIPDFYSVKGSSAFFEMSYHGLTVYRTNGMVLVKVLKVKQNNLGEREAEVWFMYDRPSGRYIPCDEEGAELAGDHRDKNWLEKINK